MRNPFKKLDMQEIIDYLHKNSARIDDKVAEDIMAAIVKSKANKVLFFRTEK